MDWLKDEISVSHGTALLFGLGLIAAGLYARQEQQQAVYTAFNVGYGFGVNAGAEAMNRAGAPPAQLTGAQQRQGAQGWGYEQPDGSGYPYAPGRGGGFYG